MLTVIADDLTGAAEIAGIGYRYGVDVKFTIHNAQCTMHNAQFTIHNAQLTQSEQSISLTPYLSPLTTNKNSKLQTLLVVATDIRQMTEEEAMNTLRETARALPHEGKIFLKVDSALRGHVVAMLQSLLEVTHYTHALYLPANPSRGRTIAGGRMLIHGMPIHETEFAHDPEFPIRQASIGALFPGMRTWTGHPERGIYYTDIQSTDDITRILTLADSNCLIAGAADAFEALLRQRGAHVSRPSSGAAFPLQDVIIVCGSTQSKPLSTGITVAPMPAEVYHAKVGAETWAAAIASRYAEEGAVVLRIDHQGRTGRQAALWLREAMATTVEKLVEIRPPRHIIVEGGATAFAIIHRLGWQQWEVADEIAPGVVALSHGDCTLTLKPGSYPWKNGVKKS